VKTLTEEYTYLAGAKSVPLSIRYKDKIIPWEKKLRVSSIPSYLEGCLYKLYLISVGTLQEEPPEDQKRKMANGALGHKMRQLELKAVEVESTKKGISSLLLKSFSEEQRVGELSLEGSYRGLHLTGHPDLVTFSKGEIKSLEEWKFVASAKPSIRESYKLQTLIYAYLLQNWFSTEEFKVSIKVFSQNKEIVEPLLTESYIFNSLMKVKVDCLLEEVYRVFTGQIDCSEVGDSFDCSFCKVSTACPHNQVDRNFNNYSLSFACGTKSEKLKRGCSM